MMSTLVEMREHLAKMEESYGKDGCQLGTGLVDESLRNAMVLLKNRIEIRQLEQQVAWDKMRRGYRVAVPL